MNSERSQRVPTSARDSGLRCAAAGRSPRRRAISKGIGAPPDIVIISATASSAKFLFLATPETLARGCF